MTVQRVTAQIQSFCPSLKIHSLSVWDLFRGSDWVWCFSFCCCFCCCFAQGLTQSPVWPSDKQLSEAARRAERGVGENGGVESLCMCVHMLGCDCTCVFAFTHTLCCKSLILPAPSGHISCNRPSAKARQLTIRGGDGGGGGGGGGLWDGGLYQRLSIIHNHKPHTLTGLRAGISVQLCVCFSELTDMNTHKERNTALWYSPKNRRED